MVERHISFSDSGFLRVSFDSSTQTNWREAISEMAAIPVENYFGWQSRAAANTQWSCAC